MPEKQRRFSTVDGEALTLEQLITDEAGGLLPLEAVRERLGEVPHAVLLTYLQIEHMQLPD